MSGFRGSDDELDREIAALQGMARIRLKRTVREFSELDRDLRELVKERTRRRATSGGESAEPAAVPAGENAASA
jgi:hypothetical protein